MPIFNFVFDFTIIYNRVGGGKHILSVLRLSLSLTFCWAEFSHHTLWNINFVYSTIFPPYFQRDQRPFLCCIINLMRWTMHTTHNDECNKKKTLQIHWSWAICWVLLVAAWRRCWYSSAYAFMQCELKNAALEVSEMHFDAEYFVIFFF